MFKRRCTASSRQKFFVDRVINVWDVPPYTVNFTSLHVLEIACGLGSMKRSGVRPSVCLSVPSIDNSDGVQLVCC